MTFIWVYALITTQTPKGYDLYTGICHIMNFILVCAISVKTTVLCV